MQCDMCGADKPLILVDIEGTELNVCNVCAQHGKPIRQRQSPRSNQRSFGNNRRAPRREEPRMQESIVEDFAKKLRDARSKLGVKQEEIAKKIAEKESVVHKLETGILEPTVRLARKLERLYSIKLIEMVEKPTHIAQKSEKTKEVTLGDVITIRKRK